MIKILSIQRYDIESFYKINFIMDYYEVIIDVKVYLSQSFLKSTILMSQMNCLFINIKNIILRFRVSQITHLHNSHYGTMHIFYNTLVNTLHGLEIHL